MLQHEILGSQNGAGENGGGKLVKKLVERHVEYIKKSVEKQPHLER